MDKSPEVGTPNEKPHDVGVPKAIRRLEQQVSAKDRTIAELRKQMDAQGGQLVTQMKAVEAERDVLLSFVTQRDDVIALQASLTSRLLSIYRPAAVQFVQAEVAAASARLQEDARRAAEETAASDAENRT